MSRNKLWWWCKTQDKHCSHKYCNDKNLTNHHFTGWTDTKMLIFAAISKVLCFIFKFSALGIYMLRLSSWLIEKKFSLLQSLKRIFNACVSLPMSLNPVLKYLKRESPLYQSMLEDVSVQPLHSESFHTFLHSLKGRFLSITHT